MVQDERKWVFVSQLCRSIWLDFDQEVDVRGIEAYRYRPPFSVYDMRSPGIYSLIYLTLIGMSYESKKNAHVLRHLGTFFVRLNELVRVSN